MQRRNSAWAYAMALMYVLIAAAQTVRADAAPGDDGERGPPAKGLTCVHVQTEAHFRGYAYDHEVVIDNACDKAVVCSVKTDVNPEQNVVNVPAHEARRVVTFHGSPAREFKADVQCKPAP